MELSVRGGKDSSGRVVQSLLELSLERVKEEGRAERTKQRRQLLSRCKFFFLSAGMMVGGRDFALESSGFFSRPTVSTLVLVEVGEEPSG